MKTERKESAVSSAASRFVHDFQHCCVSTQFVIVLLATVLAIVAFKTYEGYEIYVLEPGEDDGFVCARVSKWWGLYDKRYQLKRFFSDGYDHWHVRRAYSHNAQWDSLHVTDEDRNTRVRFPE